MLALHHVFCSAAAAAVVINTGLLLIGSTVIFHESSMGTSETVQSTGRLFDPSPSWEVLSLQEDKS